MNWILLGYSFDTGELLVLALVALFIGMAKTGVHGAGMLAVPLLAGVFGGQESSGVMLPILIMADVMGVWYYRKHASWDHLKLLFPWAAVGIVVGTVAGIFMDAGVFKAFMAVTILISVMIMIWLEQGPNLVPTARWFGAASGVAGGFTSMVGNLAGSVMAVYFLSVRLPKNIFIGTTAWFFIVVNAFKVPFHIFFWKTISWDIVILDLMLLPLIVIGAIAGIWIVRQFSDRSYRWFIMAMTVLAALSMLIPIE